MWSSDRSIELTDQESLLICCSVVQEQRATPLRYRAIRPRVPEVQTGCCMGAGGAVDQNLGASYEVRVFEAVQGSGISLLAPHRWRR